MDTVASISVSALQSLVGTPFAPLVVDVRKPPAFDADPEMIAGALRRSNDAVEEWARKLPRDRALVAYCVHGHEVSQGAAKALGAHYLEGGIEAWRAAGGELFGKPRGASSRWVTRERPKIDRIACPWLVRRFVDPEAEFLYVPAPDVKRVAAERDAVPYDIPDVEFSHEGDRCSFDAFVRHFRLRDPALDELAVIVRGADTDRMDFAPQAAGLAALSLDLSINFRDDHRMLEQGMVVYDALYSWCRKGKAEVHTWNPDLVR